MKPATQKCPVAEWTFNEQCVLQGATADDINPASTNKYDTAIILRGSVYLWYIQAMPDFQHQR